MRSIVKVVGPELTLTAGVAHTVSRSVSINGANVSVGATLVRLVANTNTLITVANNSVTTGTFTVPAGQVTFVAKSATDTVTANAGCLASPVAYH